MRPLPQPLYILDGDKRLLTLATAGDVGAVILRRLPEETARKTLGSTWPASRSMPQTAAIAPTYRSRSAWCSPRKALRANRDSDVRCRLFPAEHAVGADAGPWEGRRQNPNVSGSGTLLL
jgi:hypothetical protein